MEKITEFMTSDVISIDINSKLLEAIQMMRLNNIGAIIVEENNDATSIFTERDLLKKFRFDENVDPNTLELKDYIAPKLLFVDSEASYLEALQIMKDNKLRHIPVSKKGEVVGIVSIRDLTRRLQNHIETKSREYEIANEQLKQEIIDRMRAENELARKVENLSILYSVSKALNFASDLKKVLLFILDKARDALGAQKASLMLLDDKTKELIVHVVRGIPPEVEEKINTGKMDCTRIKIGEGIAGQAAQSKGYILVDDVEHDERFKKSDNSFVESILCVPLIVNDEVIGVINLTNKQKGGKFGQEDVNILLTLAGHSAITIHNARLYHLAITDGLTQLRIHRYFQQRLDEEITRSEKFKHPLSLIMSDLDFFKKVNDTYGHQQGDIILIETAKLFRQNVREVDIAARYGGEEFAVILPETDAEEAMKIAETLRKKIEEHEFPAQDGTLKVTISMGVATFPTNVTEKDDLIKQADLALYEAKDSGRNQVKLSEKKR